MGVDGKRTYKFKQACEGIQGDVLNLVSITAEVETSQVYSTLDVRQARSSSCCRLVMLRHTGSTQGLPQSIQESTVPRPVEILPFCIRISGFCSSSGKCCAISHLHCSIWVAADLEI